MVSAEVSTSLRAGSVLVELVDGQLAYLRLPVGQQLPGSVGELRELLTQALRQHARDRDEAIMSAVAGADSPDRARLRAWLADQLARARASATGSRSSRLPTRADGRDASRRVHISLTMDEVVGLEIPPDLLSDGRAVEDAVREAFNQAATRLYRDTVEHAVDLDSEPPMVEPDWRALASDLRGTVR